MKMKCFFDLWPYLGMPLLKLRPHAVFQPHFERFYHFSLVYGLSYPGANKTPAHWKEIVCEISDRIFSIKISVRNNRFPRLALCKGKKPGKVGVT